MNAKPVRAKEEKIEGTIGFDLIVEMWGRRIKKRARVVFEVPAVEKAINFERPLDGVSSYSIEVYGREYDDLLGRQVTRWVKSEDLISEAIMPDAVSWKIWDAIDAKAEAQRKRPRKNTRKAKNSGTPDSCDC